MAVKRAASKGQFSFYLEHSPEFQSYSATMQSILQSSTPTPPQPIDYSSTVNLTNEKLPDIRRETRDKILAGERLIFSH